MQNRAKTVPKPDQNLNFIVGFYIATLDIRGGRKVVRK